MKKKSTKRRQEKEAIWSIQITYDDGMTWLSFGSRINGAEIIGTIAANGKRIVEVSQAKSRHDFDRVSIRV